MNFGGYRKIKRTEKVADPHRSKFPPVEELLHLGPGVVEVDYVGRFKRTAPGFWKASLLLRQIAELVEPFSRVKII